MEEVKQDLQVTDAKSEKPKKQNKAVTGKVFYKKVTVEVQADGESVTLECIRLKGDEKLEVGKRITVRGELRKRSEVLEFGNGCTYVTGNEQEVGSDVVAALKNLQEGEVFANGFCALTGTVAVIEKMPNELPQKLSLYIGALTMFFAAVFFMLMADLSFNNTSSSLIVATLLSFGSAILFFLSANYGEKLKIMYSLKAVGVLLALGFIVYIHWFMNFDAYYLGKLDEFVKKGASGVADLAKTKATVIVTLILSYVSLVAQVANTVLVAVIKDE